MLLLGLIVATVLAYNVWIGADFTEDPGGSNRFVAITMPLFFVLLSCCLDACATAVARTSPKFAPIAKLGAGGVLAVLTVLALITVDLPIRNEALGFGFNDYKSLPLASLALLNPPTGIALNDVGVQIALQVEQLTDPDARLMVAGAGIVPYFTDRFSVEVLGKTDRVIAHENWKRMQDGAVWKSFYPGHFKWDYAYAIGEKQPDLIVNLLPWDEQSAQPFLNNYHPLDNFYARNDSPHVHSAVGNNSTAPNVEAIKKEMETKLAKMREQQAQSKH